MKKLFRIMSIIVIGVILTTNMRLDHVSAARLKDRDIIKRISTALDSLECMKCDFGLDYVD